MSKNQRSPNENADVEWSLADVPFIHLKILNEEGMGRDAGAHASEMQTDSGQAPYNIVPGSRMLSGAPPPSPYTLAMRYNLLRKN